LTSALPCEAQKTIVVVTVFDDGDGGGGGGGIRIE
jgi:hypothetical protein